MNSRNPWRLARRSSSATNIVAAIAHRQFSAGGLPAAPTMAHYPKALVTTLKVGPHIGATTAARLTHTARLEIGQPHFVGPRVAVQRDMMAAVAVDQDPAHAHLAHFAKCDLERPAVGLRRGMAFGARHDAIEARRSRESNCRLLVVWNARGLLGFVGVKSSLR